MQSQCFSNSSPRSNVRHSAASLTQPPSVERGGLLIHMQHHCRGIHTFPFSELRLDFLRYLRYFAASALLQWPSRVLEASPITTHEFVPGQSGPLYYYLWGFRQ